MIHDQGVDESDGFAKARQALDDARDVIILGFGYDERSVRRLGLTTHIPERIIFGSTHGLRREDQERIEMLFESQRINLDHYNRESRHYLGYFQKVILAERKRVTSA